MAMVALADGRHSISASVIAPQPSSKYFSIELVILVSATASTSLRAVLVGLGTDEVSRHGISSIVVRSMPFSSSFQRHVSALHRV